MAAERDPVAPPSPAAPGNAPGGTYVGRDHSSVNAEEMSGDVFNNCTFGAAGPEPGGPRRQRKARPKAAFDDPSCDYESPPAPLESIDPDFLAQSVRRL